jgi:hypothetical protein
VRGDCRRLRALPSCPERLAINDVLRYRMYARDYSWSARACALLQRRSQRLALAGCPAPCAGTCPHDVDQDAMLDAPGA